LNEFAQQRYLAPFDLSTWSQELGMSPYQLIRAFKHSTGMTPNQWVIHHRIKHSLGHLSAGASITDSALAAGFYDAAHYHRHFKKIMGVTPATFQQS
jgi:AraC-like DNA-binding protein